MDRIITVILITISIIISPQIGNECAQTAAGSVAVCSDEAAALCHHHEL